MAVTLAEIVREAADLGRDWAKAFPDAVTGDDLPWKVIEAFDAGVRGHIERDPRIEDERDRVLIAAMKLAEEPAGDDDGLDEARRALTDAIDYLEQSVLRFGIVNRKAAERGYGSAGNSVSADS